MKELKKSKIPIESLASFDAGSIPWGPIPGATLEQCQS